MRTGALDHGAVMEFTDQISTLIFALILLSVCVFMLMGAYVVGPVSRLKKGERIVLVIGIAGIGGVLAYAASELLFHFVF
jgi:hypothetical protein